MAEARPHSGLVCVFISRELMMGEEGRPGKKIKVKGRVKRPDRPPENPVIDVSPCCRVVHFGMKCR